MLDDIGIKKISFVHASHLSVLYVQHGGWIYKSGVVDDRINGHPRQGGLVFNPLVLRVLDFRTILDLVGMSCIAKSYVLFK